MVGIVIALKKIRPTQKLLYFPRAKGMGQLLLLQRRGGTMECPSHATAAIPMAFLQAEGPSSAPLLSNCQSPKP